MVRVSKSNSSSAPKIPSIEIHEPHEQQHNGPFWRTKMHRIAIEFASTFVGQAIMMQFDKLLWTLEKTTTWISSGKTDAKKPVNLIRPLPWILFLPTLVALRYTRVILSLLSICLGYDEIEVSTMVTWLHQSRRTIRHIVLEANRNEQLKAAAQSHTNNDTNNNTSIDCFKRIILSLVSNLSGLIFSTPYTIALHSNKTSLNSSTVDETKRRQQQQQPQQQTPNNDIGITSNTDEDSDDEDRTYQDFLSRTIESSDADDEDYVHDVNGADISSSSSLSSHADSQSSIATENMSNDEIDDMNRSVEAETSKTSEASEAFENDSHSNVDDVTNVASDRSENVAEEETKQNDIDATQNVQIDNALNQLIDDTAAAAGNNNVIQRNRGGKNNKRHHKNGGGGGAGRSHTKAQQNNGKHLNGAHSQDESKSAVVVASAEEVPTTNHHANTFHEFTVTEAAADHTPTD